MKLVVAVDEAWGIGRNNKLLFSIPEDMAFFKELTQEKTVIMGHATLNSLPRSSPLKNRINIVLSKNKDLKIADAVICASISQLGRELNAHNSDEVYVIGGRSIYTQLLPYCDEAFVTKVYANGQADRFFPNIDHYKNWVLKEQSEIKSYNGLNYSFCLYQNKCVENIPNNDTNITV